MEQLWKTCIFSEYQSVSHWDSDCNERLA